MKLTGLIILLLILTSPLYAQQRITGLLMSELTRLPLPHAAISAGAASTNTNGAGIFTINLANHPDSIRINCVGYQYYAFKPVAVRKDTMVIYLQPESRTLNEVVIRARRNFKADSARTRRDFANVFAYKSQGVMDMFADKHYGVEVPWDHITSNRSTADIVGVNMLSVIGLLSKKGDNTSKLQKQLLQDEANNYLDRAFSTAKVVNITNLKGDSLQTFMIRYRPTIKQAKKWNDFEMIGYIRKCLGEFLAESSKPKA